MDRLALYKANCLQILDTLPQFDVVITDPPYPDYHVDKYGFEDISFLLKYNCRQFIFWSSKAEFPLDYTAIHIWDKKTGAGSEYERIFERNGQKNFKVFRHYFINSTVAASFTQDVFTGHPSQKPKSLMREIVEKFTKPDDVIFDPFMGSGSTGVACVELGRKFIGIEKSPKYFEIAKRRIESAQPPLFASAEQRPTKRAPDLWDSAPSQALSTPEADTIAGHLSTPPTSG